jgi:shikimate 5-dehydrogenase
VTCEGERLSFRNGIERVREDCICCGASGIGAALTTKLVDGGAEIWIADRQIGLAQELAQRRVTQAGNDRAARVIGYHLRGGREPFSTSISSHSLGDVVKRQ